MASEPVPVQATVYLGDEFELDLRLHLLRRFGRVLRLERIPMELLVLLVEARGHVVTRDQIVTHIWGKDVFLDTDNSINGAVRKLRQALRDNSEQPRFIQTVTGKGYRFIAPVTSAPADTVVPVLPPDTPVLEPAAAAPAPRRWPLLLAACFLLLAIIAFSAWSRSRTPSAPVAHKLVIAILPFENLTGDAQQDYFIDGLMAETIVQLGRSDPSHLGVIARTSVMRYRKSVEQVQRIARELGVDYVLEGSVRREGAKARITAELVEAARQTPIWARAYDRELDSPLVVQGELAREISDEIQLTLGEPKGLQPVRRSPPSASREAREYYIRGRYFWNKRSPSGFAHAREFFRQAIAKDPNYAPAYAGLADCYLLMSSYYVGKPADLIPKARSAALRALELDQNSAEAHTSLALLSENYDWDWQTAEKEYRRAIQLDPNYATAHHWYAELLGFEGRFPEALAESERARALDPLSLIIATDDAALLYFAGQYDRAIEEIRVVLDMEPNFSRAHYLLTAALVEKGSYSQALAHTESWRGSEPAPWVSLVRAYIYGRMGRQAEARRAFQRVLALHRDTTPDPMIPAVLSLTGHKQEAFNWLDRAYRDHSNAITVLKVEHLYDSLRSDPRYADLLRRAGLDRY